jgi:hypothetical protein
MKNARYLDHESLTMFYPIILKQFIMLTDHLVQDGHQEMAKNVLKKYDDVMPNLYPYTEVAARKYYIIEDAYKVGEAQLGNKWANEIDDYILDILSYNANLVQNNADGVQLHDVQLSMSILNGLASMTKDFHQTALSAKYSAQLKEYEGKLGSILRQQQQ